MNKIESIDITDKQSWLESRLQDVTSTEVSALYGLNPYSTEYELYHQKKNKEIIHLDENERMTWGLRLEKSIAEGAAETMKWDIEPMNVYMRKPDNRIGSSFDYKINSKADGPGILEVKNVDGMVYHRNWVDDGQGNIEAPEHIELQVQHQMEVADMEWCAIVALVGGNTQKIVHRKRDRTIGDSINAKVKKFWDLVDAGRAPSPDYEKDAEYIIKTLRGQATEGLIAEADGELEELIKAYGFAQREASDMKKLQDSYKAQILERVNDASKVIFSNGSISCGMTKPSLGTLVTPEMVDTYVGARKGFRSFRLTKKKGS